MKRRLRFKNTPAGIAALIALNANKNDVLANTLAGIPPIHTIAPLIADYLGDRNTNAMVGRIIREWLGPSFIVKGRKKWTRRDGTESGSFYALV